MISRYTTIKTESGVSADATCLDLSMPRAYRIPDVCKLTGLGRTSIYAAIKSGELIARRWRRRTLVLATDLQAFLNNLPKSS
jgi:excisionase family DNA binding protein